MSNDIPRDVNKGHKVNFNGKLTATEAADEEDDGGSPSAIDGSLRQNDNLWRKTRDDENSDVVQKHCENQ